MLQSNPCFDAVVIDLINARRGIEVDVLGREMVYHSVKVKVLCVYVDGVARTYASGGPGHSASHPCLSCAVLNRRHSERCHCAFSSSAITHCNIITRRERG